MVATRFFRRNQVPASQEDTAPPDYPLSAEKVSENEDTLSKEEENNPGVAKVEAGLQVWDKKTLVMLYVWIWVCYFMLAFHLSIGLNANVMAYNSFMAAPQLSTAYILSTIIGGVIQLPIAKMLNLWGRAEGFAVFLGVYLIGIIVLASCTGPNSFAAGYVLYWIGYDAIYLILQVFVADTSGLRNRAFAFAYALTPYICTAFTGPLAAESFLNRTSWRWCYGAFAIIMPFVFGPLIVVFKYYQIKAKKMGLVKTQHSGRTTLQSIVHYFHEFDIIGAFLLMAAFVIFLLPFSLNTYGRAQYHSATFIAMVVVGFCLFPVFFVWEKYFARVHFIRYSLLKDRTVLGACSLAAVLYFSFYGWDLYYYYFVMVVYNLSISDTGYMTQIYNVGSCFWSVVFGLWVRYIKTFKYTCLFFGLPLMILGTGLYIHFTVSQGNIGYIIMCQIFIAFAGGTLVIGEDMAVMAASDTEGIPLMLALLGLSSRIGGAVGSAVSAAIYRNVFPSALLAKLPESAKADYQTIYLGGSTTQLTYPVGSEIRNAINYAYGQSQRDGAIAGCAILALAIPAIAIWRNYNVDKKQHRGVVI